VDIKGLVANLRLEATHIEKAIAALAGLDQTTPRRGRPAKASQPVRSSGRKRRTMSAAARAKIAPAQRARWAKQKGHAVRGKSQPAQKKAAGRKPMSAAIRKKLSRLMKARWAARRTG
jgi:hypothetical protein